MKTRRAGAGLAVGLLSLMIPARWAAADDAPAPTTVEAQHAGVQSRAQSGENRAERASGPGPSAAGAALTQAPLPELAFSLLAIQGAAFYTSVGRPDLAEAYSNRHALKWTSRIIGIVSLSIGVLAWSSYAVLSGPLGGCQSRPEDPACNKTLWVPDIMTAGGLALIMGPSFFDTHPVSMQEKVGLADAAVFRWRQPPRAQPLSLVPRVERDGGSLMLSGRF